MMIMKELYLKEGGKNLIGENSGEISWIMGVDYFSPNVLIIKKEKGCELFRPETKDIIAYKKGDIIARIGSHRVKRDDDFFVQIEQIGVTHLLGCRQDVFVQIEQIGDIDIHKPIGLYCYDRESLLSHLEQILSLKIRPYKEFFEYATIVYDPFNYSIGIGRREGFEINISDSLKIILDFTNGESCIEIDITFHGIRMTKGDCVSLLFDDGSIVDYIVSDNPKKQVRKGYDNEKLTTYSIISTLYKEDIEKFINMRLLSYRITVNRPSKDNITRNVGGLKPEEFSIYAKYYIGTIKKLIPDYVFPHRYSQSDNANIDFQGCYLYLMRDNANHYFKIGISNKPEYREKTLQSEKPSIEMLACKKFPTRKIAEAIESALHTAYSQQRLRGEWFNLTDADVAAIIETLK